MVELNMRNVTMMALTASCFLQLGGQLFALAVIVSTILEAPPRSFAILAGDYPYDSSAFWETLPPITAILFLIALIANWKTARRNLVLAALGFFVLGGVLAGFLLEPEFAKVIETGYRDAVDSELQGSAKRLYALDWAVWSVTLMSGIALLLALATPAGPQTSKQLQGTTSK